ERFATLAELVQRCKADPDMLKESDGNIIRLHKALYSDNPPTERCFHGNLMGKEAEILIGDKNVRNGTYLFRWSQCHPGNIVLSVNWKEQLGHIPIEYKDGRFRVGDEKWFHSLQSLAKHYSQLGYGVKQPMNRTTFSASGIKGRITELELESANQRTGKSGFGEEFDTLHHMESANLYSRNAGNEEHNKPKNRYKNILPFDYTRVILTDKSDELSDYINANYITMKKVGEDLGTTFKKSFIASQGCLENTTLDFWRMVWQENCRVIVMTIKEVERGKKKCAKYWPDPEKEKTFDYLNGKMIIECSQRTHHQYYSLREFIIKLQGATGHSNESRKVYQFHFTTWPDHGVPDNPGPALGFLQDIDDKQKSIPNAGPVVVHCRCVTKISMIAIHIHTGADVEIDIRKMVQIIRSQRSGMVQTEAQYRFIYMAVSHHIETMLKRDSQKQVDVPKLIRRPISVRSAQDGRMKPR
ncbi:hypothetical protein LSH36_1253g00018, partial [Paralvinella palmiformis]